MFFSILYVRSIFQGRVGYLGHGGQGMVFRMSVALFHVQIHNILPFFCCGLVLNRYPDLLLLPDIRWLCCGILDTLYVRHSMLSS